MSLQTITDLLNKQKLVEGMVKNQAAARNDLVQSLVHNQHLAELEAVVTRLPSGEIAAILEMLPPLDARLVWSMVPAERRNDVLWELPPPLAGSLTGGVEPRFEKGRVTAYEIVNGRMSIVEIERRSDMEGIHPIWVDVLGASRSERGWIARRFGLEIPDPEELTDLETSARYYEEESDEVHLHSSFLLDREGSAGDVPVAFVIHNGLLLSIRTEELPVFRLQRLRMRSQPGEVTDCKDVLLALYGANVEYAADALEDTYDVLRQVGRKVLSQDVTDADAARILADIAEEEDINGRIRGNMLDSQRAVSFLVRSRFLNAEQLEDAREIIRDIESLNSHTAFLFDKINFLMDATVGFINVNQNRRVTQLTVAGVVFMPLNVLAGVGGMSEFSMMTAGIPWPLAYGAFILVMVLVGWVTYTVLRTYEARRAKAAKAPQPALPDRRRPGLS